MKKLVLLLIAGFLLSCQQDINRTVYLVRHAEKDLTDKTDNPPLTQIGVQRAMSLADRLKDEEIAAIYSTPLQRTTQTVFPLSDLKRVKIEFYEWNDYAGLKKRINGLKNKGAVVICGHGNNLLPIIRTLGSIPPLDSIGHDEYDHIFVIKNGITEVMNYE
jgi:2,3-bisphosphoglycerate-dependent phosphoglycerate mutase